MHTNKVESVHESVEIHDKSSTGVIKFVDLPANKKFVVRIPYDVETTLRELSMRPEVTYTTEHGEFLFFGDATILVELPLDVNVFDIFKENALFSKFSVRTATRVPLHLLSVELTETDAFAVASPSRSISPMLVFARGPASFTYKIVKASPVSSSTANTSLTLTVKYRCVDEDVLESTEGFFRAELSKSSIADFAPILIPTLRTKLTSGDLDINYERAAMLGELPLGSFEDMRWSDIIFSLPKARREEVSSWLQNWHNVSINRNNMHCYATDLLS